MATEIRTGHKQQEGEDDVNGRVTNDREAREGVNTEADNVPVRNGTQSVQEKTDDASNGTHSVQEKTTDVCTGKRSVQEKTTDVSTGTHSVQENTTDVSTGTHSVQENTTDHRTRTDVSTGTHGVKGKMNDVTTGAQNVREMTGNVRTGTDSVHDKTSAVSTGTHGAQEETNAVSTGTHGVHQKANDVSITTNGTQEKTSGVQAQTTDVNGGVDSIPTLHVQSDSGFNAKIEDGLERINIAIAEINRLSGDVFKIRARFRDSLKTARGKLARVYKVNRKHVEKARSYYRAKADAAKIKDQFVRLSMEYRQACLDFDDAKENAAAAEAALMCNSLAVAALREDDEPDVLINLNKANEKVFRSSEKKSRTAEQKKKTSLQITVVEQRVQQLYKLAGPRAVDKAAAYFELRTTLEKELQRQLHEVRQQMQLLQDSKDRYKSAFDSLDELSAELEQRQRALALNANSTPDLSKFEEIDSIDDALDNHSDFPSRDRARSLDSARSADSFESDVSLKAVDKHGRPLCRAVSLDEVVVHEVTSDPLHHDPRDQLANYAVSFQMEV